MKRRHDMATVWGLAFFASGLCFLTGCASVPGPDLASWQVKQGAADVLIATEQSEFKDAVVRKVTSRLQDMGLSYRVIKLKDLRFESADKYKAVVMLHSVWAWKVTAPVAALVKRTPVAQRGGLILVNTAGDEEWRANLTQVDAVTTASQPDRVRPTAGFVVGRIREATE